MTDYETRAGRVLGFVAGLYVVGTLAMLVGAAVALDKQRKRAVSWWSFARREPPPGLR